MKITISPTHTKKLREALENEGFRFPCGGKGVCGRCKINAPDIKPTSLDYRFFSQKDINDGFRLACDKIIDTTVEIDCFMQKESPKRKLFEPTVTAILGDTASEISIVEEGIVETLVLPSPSPQTVKVRSLIGKNAIELYEKFGVAKASVILVGGTPQMMAAFCGTSADLSEYSQMGDTMEASLFDMPSEEVYLPPVPNAYAGSLELLELDDLPDKSLLVLADKVIKFMYKGDTVIPAATLTVGEYGDQEGRAVVATLQFFKESYQVESIIVVGKLPLSIEQEIDSLGIKFAAKESAATARAAACVEDNRYKTRLNKLSRKTTKLILTEEERWQEIFSLS